MMNKLYHNNKSDDNRFLSTIFPEFEKYFNDKIHWKNFYIFNIKEKSIFYLLKKGCKKVLNNIPNAYVVWFKFILNDKIYYQIWFEDVHMNNKEINNIWFKNWYMKEIL